MPRRTLELALVVSLVAGFFYLGDSGRLWVFWLPAVLVSHTAVGWYERRKVRRLAR